MTDQGLPSGIARCLIIAGLIGEAPRSKPIGGGRTNRVWSVSGLDGADLMVKLFAGASDNPLFPNTAAHENVVLRALAGEGLAPTPRYLGETPDGTVLVYDRLDGPRWSGDPRPVAGLLGRVHACVPPVGLRHLPGGAAQLLDQTRSILKSLKNPAPLSNLLHQLPESAEFGGYKPCLIHTDVVAENIIQTRDGPMLIDWQCPAIGDPCEDIASFLSPAMQTLYGEGPLGEAQVTRFLQSYPDAAPSRRYRQLAPFFHARMAAYCRWQADRGEKDYQPAMLAELDALTTALAQMAHG